MTAMTRSSSAQHNEEEPTAEQRARLLSVPAEWLRRFRVWAATSPGKLGSMLIALVLGCVVVAVVAGLTVMDKQDRLDDLVKHRQAVSSASQEVYRSLTDSEASSAAAFLNRGANAERSHDRYRKDLERMGSALAVAAGEAPDNRSARKLSRLLPRYAAMLEAAYANHGKHSGGSADLVKASSLMREQMLTPAQLLYGNEQTELRDEEDSASSVPWVAGALVLLLLVGLWLVQRYVRRRTNRSFNVGLVVSTVAVLAMVLWSAGVLTIAGLHVAAGKDRGSEQVLTLSRVRLLAVQARGSENLALVASSSGDYQREFDDLVSKLRPDDGSGGLLSKAGRLAEGTSAASDVEKAKDSLGTWLRAHRSLRDKASAGDTPGAKQLAVGDGSDSAATRFAKVDSALDSAVGKARKQFVHSTNQARDTLFLLDIGVIVLSVVAAAGAAGGLWQRIREYR